MFPAMLLSQEQVSGVILETTDDERTTPLFGANVYWLNTSVGTTTDEDGSFTIAYKKDYKKLVVSFVGFKTDTLTVTNPSLKIRHVLKSTSELDEVVLEGRKQTTAKSYLKAENIITVSSEELLKAACCNLSESFETKSVN